MKQNKSGSKHKPATFGDINVEAPLRLSSEISLMTILVYTKLAAAVPKLSTEIYKQAKRTSVFAPQTRQLAQRLNFLEKRLNVFVKQLNFLAQGIYVFEKEMRVFGQELYILAQETTVQAEERRKVSSFNQKFRRML